MNGNQWGGDSPGFYVDRVPNRRDLRLYQASSPGHNRTAPNSSRQARLQRRIDTESTTSSSMPTPRSRRSWPCSGLRCHGPDQRLSAARSRRGGLRHEIDGTATTLDADGTAPQAATPPTTSARGHAVDGRRGPGPAGRQPRPRTAAAHRRLGGQSGHGTVTVNPDGSFVYTPNPGYTGRRQLPLPGQRRRRRHRLGHRHAAGPVAARRRLPGNGRGGLASGRKPWPRSPAPARRPPISPPRSPGATATPAPVRSPTTARAVHRQRQQHLRRGGLLHDRRDDRRRERGDASPPARPPSRLRH